MSAPIVLVTGAPGWLGTRLVDVLAHGLPEVPGLASPLGERRVRCLVLPGSDTAALRAVSPRVEIVQGDITAPSSLEPFFAGTEGASLFHCAGVIHPSAGTRQFREVNVEGTRHLVTLAQRAKVRRMVHVSSNSPIGTNAGKDDVFDESSPYNPYMGYGRSKMLAEEIVRSSNVSSSLETVIIRPPWFYGPGQPPRQALFFSMIKSGKVPIVGTGDNRRSMAYVDNICQGLLLCERTDRARGEVYWIADRRPYAMTEIVDTIERVLMRDFHLTVTGKRLRLPGVASRVAWVVDKVLQSLGFYNQKIHVLSEMDKTIACTIAKAERELGYAPSVDLEEGMRRSVSWMLANGQVL
jgi:nucleoside-diphosphate-sugar epimerase